MIKENFTIRPKRSVCFLSARNLGDAVIHADFIRALCKLGFAEKYIIWTFPEAAFLFSDIKNSQVICSYFPMGASRIMFFKTWGKSFFSGLRTIKSQHPFCTIDFISDIRERIVCMLLRSATNYHLEWENGHCFRNYARISPFRSKKGFKIPIELINLYDVYKAFLRNITNHNNLDFTFNIDWPFPVGNRNEWCGQIGIHPFASKECKLWPMSNWLSLINSLNTLLPKANFVLFGSNSDRAALVNMKLELNKDVDLFTGTIMDFKSYLKHVDMLIGLDSFSVHMAQSQGVPSVMISGPNMPELAKPPSCRVVTNYGTCDIQPCNGKPKCIGTSDEFSCMSSISSNKVIDIIFQHQ
jgi:heptosyltransferase-3